MEECPEKTAESFIEQLEHSHSIMFARIVRLLPWIQGLHYGIEPASAEAAPETKYRDRDESVPTGKEYLFNMFPHDPHEDSRVDSLKGSLGPKHLTMIKFLGGSTTESEQQNNPSSSPI
jgi:hypothetical protein